MAPIPKVKDILWWLGRVNILLVMDGIAGSAHYASFGPGDQNPDPNAGDAFFGLSEFVRTLESGFLPRFNVTKAHRDTDINGAADVENFKFDAVDLSVYDEIWLFGVADSGGTANPMTDSELADKFRQQGKPENVIAKIVESGLKTFYKEVCLLEQPYVHDDKKTVAQALKEAEGKVGGPIKVTGFVRFAVGEGVDKPDAD